MTLISNYNAVIDRSCSMASIYNRGKYRDKLRREYILDDEDNISNSLDIFDMVEEHHFFMEDIVQSIDSRGTLYEGIHRTSLIFRDGIESYITNFWELVHDNIIHKLFDEGLMTIIYSWTEDTSNLPSIPIFKGYLVTGVFSYPETMFYLTSGIYTDGKVIRVNTPDDIIKVTGVFIANNFDVDKVMGNLYNPEDSISTLNTISIM